jgi:hypothetical protein
VARTNRCGEDNSLPYNVRNVGVSQIYGDLLKTFVMNYACLSWQGKIIIKLLYPGLWYKVRKTFELNQLKSVPSQLRYTTLVSPLHNFDTHESTFGITKARWAWLKDCQLCHNFKPYRKWHKGENIYHKSWPKINSYVHVHLWVQHVHFWKIVIVSHLRLYLQWFRRYLPRLQNQLH